MHALQVLMRFFSNLTFTFLQFIEVNRTVQLNGQALLVRQVHSGIYMHMVFSTINFCF